MNETTDLAIRDGVYYSPDGYWWWNGKQWLATRVLQPAPQPTSITVKTRPTNHTFHLFMTMFTFGLWFPIWMIMTIANHFSPAVERTYSRN